MFHRFSAPYGFTLSRQTGKQTRCRPLSGGGESDLRGSRRGDVPGTARERGTAASYEESFTTSGSSPPRASSSRTSRRCSRTVARLLSCRSPSRSRLWPARYGASARVLGSATGVAKFDLAVEAWTIKHWHPHIGDDEVIAPLIEVL